MDINNYNYAPSMADDCTEIAHFFNDDVQINIEPSKDSNGARFFWVNAWSYDGSMDFAEKYTDEATARRVYDYIVDNYATTPPAGDLCEEIAGFLYPDSMDLARRVINIDLYEARNADETPASMAERIHNAPAEVISMLLDYIEQLQEV